MSFVKGVGHDPVLPGPVEVFQWVCLDMNWIVENSLDLRHSHHFWNWLVKTITHTHSAQKVTKARSPERLFIVKFGLATCYVHSVVALEETRYKSLQRDLRDLSVWKEGKITLINQKKTMRSFEKPSVFALSCSLLNAKTRDTIRYWKNPNQQTTWKTEALYLLLKQA